MSDTTYYHFVCIFCKARFHLADDLLEHIRIHTGDFPEGDGYESTVANELKDNSFKSCEEGEAIESLSKSKPYSMRESLTNEKAMYDHNENLTSSRVSDMQTLDNDSKISIDNVQSIPVEKTDDPLHSKSAQGCTDMYQGMEKQTNDTRSRISIDDLHSDAQVSLHSVKRHLFHQYDSAPSQIPVGNDNLPKIVSVHGTFNNNASIKHATVSGFQHPPNSDNAGSLSSFHNQPLLPFVQTFESNEKEQVPMLLTSIRSFPKQTPTWLQTCRAKNQSPLCAQSHLSGVSLARSTHSISTPTEGLATVLPHTEGIFKSSPPTRNGLTLSPATGDIFTMSPPTEDLLTDSLCTKKGPTLTPSEAVVSGSPPFGVALALSPTIEGVITLPPSTDITTLNTSSSTARPFDSNIVSLHGTQIYPEKYKAPTSAYDVIPSEHHTKLQVQFETHQKSQGLMFKNKEENVEYNKLHQQGKGEYAPTRQVKKGLEPPKSTRYKFKHTVSTSTSRELKICDKSKDKERCRNLKRQRVSSDNEIQEQTVKNKYDTKLHVLQSKQNSLKIASPKIKRYECPTCRRGFPRIVEQMRHKCKGQSAVAPFNLQSAYARLKIYKCLHCLVEFATLKEKQDHKCIKFLCTSNRSEKKPAKDVASVKRKVCEARHKDVPDSFRYECQICGKRFMREGWMRAHKAFCLQKSAAKNKSGKLAKAVESCNTKQKNVTPVSDQMIAQATKETITCKGCHRVFKYKWNLKLHLMWKRECKAAYGTKDVDPLTRDESGCSKDHSETINFNNNNATTCNEPEKFVDQIDSLSIPNQLQLKADQVACDMFSTTTASGQSRCNTTETMNEITCPLCVESSSTFQSIPYLSVHMMYTHNKAISKQKSGWHFKEVNSSASSEKPDIGRRVDAEVSRAKCWKCPFCGDDYYVFLNIKSYVNHLGEKHGLAANSVLTSSSNHQTGAAYHNSSEQVKLHSLEHANVSLKSKGE